MFDIKCGEYLHFKGNPYIVYGTAKTDSEDRFVLYRHDYGTREFWIRPLEMFTEIIERDGKAVQRFKLIKEVSDRESIEKLAEIFNSTPFLINHSETLEIYYISSIDTTSGKIILKKQINDKAGEHL